MVEKDVVTMQINSYWFSCGSNAIPTLILVTNTGTANAHCWDTNALRQRGISYIAAYDLSQYWVIIVAPVTGFISQSSYWFSYVGLVQMLYRGRVDY